MDFTPARQIADAVFYEGYILYPYRASAQKNRWRWQFGVLAPRTYSERSGADPWAMKTECLGEFDDCSALHLRLRFLQAQARNVEQAVDSERELFRPVDSVDIDGATLISWEEGLEREIAATVELRTILNREDEIPFEIEGNTEQELVFDSAGKIAARILRQSWPLAGRILISASRVADFPFLVKLHIEVENNLPGDQAWRERQEALRQSLLATHLLLGAEGGQFLSLLEPPEWAIDTASSCANLHTWPVLVGDKNNRNLMLSAPIILYDYPAVAPESSGNFFDATEIDELLALRTVTLTDEEKRQAKATDRRGAAVLSRLEGMAPEKFARLHGAMRDFIITPKTEEKVLSVNGVQLAIGSRVRLRPGTRRTDAQDMFLDGRLAIVKRVLCDVENKNYLAVTLVDDPAADLHEWHGRFHYFSADEVEPVIEPELSSLGAEHKRSS